MIAQFQRRIDELELEQRRSATQPDVTSDTKQQSSSSQRDGVNLTWREGRKAPCIMSSMNNYTIADGTTVYVREVGMVYCYTASTYTWSQLPHAYRRTYNGPFVIINDFLTIVGGYHQEAVSPANQLLSLTGEGSGRTWTEVFPPMPTKRCGSTALCTGTALIVAGGSQSIGSGPFYETVEVMNTETLQWSTAATLPQPVFNGPAAVCGDHVYILSVSSHDSKSMYTCSINALLQSCKSRPMARARVWNRVTAPPVTKTTCVSIDGRLLTIGGRKSNNQPTKAIYMYDPTADSWEVVSHMAKPRCYCYAAVLHNNQLMVVGGETKNGKTNSVQIATFE